jgi:hypothetical protein
MKTVCFSETLVSTYESTRRLNLEQYRHPHRRENLKSHKKNPDPWSYLASYCVFFVFTEGTGNFGFDEC